ncbi:putative glucan endo-1,3-beta-glucosidase eglC [Colletotrichum tanaceti]|uniref:Probable glucan endo-1,3-beta-glucosidase eglC n=1 Tax=Colletotrichum tanaceti TaxID=1306861 RepID=A0A4U6XFW4_9PEZI|nr:putative glucan endo-1,3-beta-glucosidase eglC [Colletotrichum tanaceti]TKW54353.1 putative glucan endo-1,3-beta-glucosidase eglC [Colletotrichum tanaceti]
MRASLALAAVYAAVTASAFQGFNYGSTFTDGRAKTQSDFEAEFKTAASLEGTKGAFTSARLYTMVQGGSASDPISAIPAAISTKTTLLLGLWASAGEPAFVNELEALKKTLAQYGSQLGGLIAGISVGSEDLYRHSPTGIANNEFAGAEPNILVKYFDQVREVIKDSPLSSVPLGHVDTWTAWVNGSNKAVIDACDWIGMDAYPYFESTKPNDISDSKDRWADALSATRAAVGGKPVWVTETGWPVSGKKVGASVPSLENARKFWDDVGCPMFGNTNVWWYTFQDSSPTTPNPSFGVIGSTLTNKPLYDLSCDKASSGSSSSTSSSSTKTVSASASSQTGGTASTSASASASASDSDSATASPTGSGSGSGSGLSQQSSFVGTATTLTTAVPISGSGAGGDGSGTATLTGSTAPSASQGSGSSSGTSRLGTNGTISVPTSTPTVVPSSGATLTTFSVVVLAGMAALAML